MADSKSKGGKKTGSETRRERSSSSPGRKSVKTPVGIGRPAVKTPSDFDSRIRESGQWAADFDEDSVLAEFQGAASALEEFAGVGGVGRESSQPGPRDEADSLQFSLDASFDATFGAEEESQPPPQAAPSPSQSPLPSSGAAPLPSSSPVPGPQGAPSPAPGYSPLPNGATPLPGYSPQPGVSPAPAMGSPTPTPLPYGMDPTQSGNYGILNNGDDAKSRSRRFWAIVIVAITAIVGATAVAIAFIVTSQPGQTAGDREPSSQVILIKGNVVAEGNGVEEAPAPPIKTQPVPIPREEKAVDGGVGVKAVPGTKELPAPRRHAGDRSEIAQAFAQQRSKIAACFESHALDVQGDPQINIHFVVNANGSVRSVTIEPSAVRGTPLGGCISKVASGTRFGAQESAVEFRIPIKARRIP